METKTDKWNERQASMEPNLNGFGESYRKAQKIVGSYDTSGWHGAHGWHGELGKYEHSGSRSDCKTCNRS